MISTQKPSALNGITMLLLLFLSIGAVWLQAATPQDAPGAEQKQGSGQSTAESAPAIRVWLDVDGRPLPSQSDDAIVEFLRTANVVSEDVIGEGVTRPSRLVLERNGVHVHAVFRSHDEQQAGVTELSRKGAEFNFRDSYLFEPAAYELSRLLGMDNIPPAIIRKVRGREGSVQIWVEKAMTEGKRLSRKIEPPDKVRWAKYKHVMDVFDALIYNTDRNEGNVLITPDWSMWFIDHTRAFRVKRSLPDPEKVRQCDRQLFQRLKSLNENVVRERLKDYLRKDEITAVLKRRDLLVERLQKLMAQRGEDHVLFTLEPVRITVESNP